MKRVCGVVVCAAMVLGAVHALADEPALPKAFVDGTGAGWRALGEADFENVNCFTNTWAWKDGVA